MIEGESKGKWRGRKDERDNELNGVRWREEELYWKEY